MVNLEHILVLEKNEQVSSKVHVLTFATEGVPQSKPGQFFELKSPYFLRRPIGVMQQSNNKISFGIRLVGKGTSALCGLSPGDRLSALGPLGRGFDLRHVSQPGDIVIVGGGSGIFPLLYLADQMRTSGLIQGLNQIYGFRSAEECFLEVEMCQHKNNMTLCSDSGGLDFHGHAVAALEAFLAEASAKPSAIFSCGPEAMMKSVVEVGKRENIPVQVSLETRMGCGIGLCRGCVVDLKDDSREAGFRRVRCCKEGPVFPGDKVIWS
ncbi:MAG: dihydroorotate dehydrogenase electron transfer subunit [Eubacteriales bacterium]|nr:dihydroorotate dehydrogenase electron transfer subunit [Eubacteriales bacterium]MDD4323723.1 dihydroorotate dehydrogenase electron transfer subunit [Eubacteriales bacterium]MDD4541953.1 dihydroorotate dehydrogenase electron transfer subunit [Eubacteriales bacterium]